MKKPEPPKPPEARMVCGACNYSAPISEYHHKCGLKISVTVLMIGVPSSLLMIGVYNLVMTLL